MAHRSIMTQRLRPGTNQQYFQAHGYGNCLWLGVVFQISASRQPPAYPEAEVRTHVQGAWWQDEGGKEGGQGQEGREAGT